jgi:hypothetical protein
VVDKCAGGGRIDGDFIVGELHREPADYAVQFPSWADYGLGPLCSSWARLMLTVVNYQFFTVNLNKRML